MKRDNLSDLDKIGLSGLASGDEHIPSSGISGLQIFVIVMLLLLVGLIIFS